jgi:hypothetical protein
MPWTPTDCLWLAAGLAAFVVCLPMLLGTLGCTRFRAKALPSPEACAPASEGPEYLFYHRQLLALGFTPLGVIVERGYYLGFHYVKCFRFRVFVHRELGVYASVYRLFPGDEFRFAISTLLTDGWFVQTGSSMAALTCAGDKYYRWGVTTRVVAELLQAHLDWLRSRWEEGDAVAPIDLAALAERMKEVNQARASHWFNREALDPLAIALVVLCSSAALGCSVPAWRHLLVPSGLLLGSVIYRPLMTFLLGWAARGMRREDVERKQHAPEPLDSPTRRHTMLASAEERIQSPLRTLPW